LEESKNQMVPKLERVDCNTVGPALDIIAIIDGATHVLERIGEMQSAQDADALEAARRLHAAKERAIAGTEPGHNFDTTMSTNGSLWMAMGKEALRIATEKRNELKARLLDALLDAYEALKAVLPVGHDGDEESGQCDEACQRCIVDGAMAHIDHVLETTN
jgi:hypothetical protein